MDLRASIRGGNRGFFAEKHDCVRRVLEEGYFWRLQIADSGVLFATLTWPFSSPRQITNAGALPVEFWRKPFSRKSAQVTQIATGRRSPRVLALCVRNGVSYG